MRFLIDECLHESLVGLCSYAVGPRPVDLVFSSDGETHWLEGAQLLAVYLILGFVFYFLP